MLQILSEALMDEQFVAGGLEWNSLLENTDEDLKEMAAEAEIEDATGKDHPEEAVVVPAEGLSIQTINAMSVEDAATMPEIAGVKAVAEGKSSIYSENFLNHLILL